MGWIVLILAVILGWVVFAYNRLVRLRNQVRTGWADIDVQLTWRHDLVPQLVTAVQAYASHERAVLEAVTELRSQAVQQKSPARLAETERSLEQALGRIFALQEAYPELKASENFLQLQRDLVSVEEHLQYARRFYNGAVRDYNDSVQRFPDMFVANAGAFQNAEFYQAREEERAAVQIGALQ
ncbi:MAG TPA: LemA family protein [Steroidobacteraceae bacterium]|nr:LemA family protein [Steroidobacteraceae bacterium]